MVHPLTRDQEQELARRASSGDGAALDELVRANLWIVGPIVGQVLRASVQQHDRDDLAQEGALGLLEAARRYEPGHGTRLSTYATYWVRMRVRERLRRATAPPLRSLDVPADARVRPVDEYSGDDSPRPPLRDVVPSSEPSPRELAELSEHLSLLPRALLRLTPRQRLVVEAIHGIGRPRRSMGWVATRLRISPQRVAQVLARALEVLREGMGS